VRFDTYVPVGDNGVGFPYHGDEGPLIPFYKELQSVASSAPGKVRVLIYSGDVDPYVRLISFLLIPTYPPCIRFVSFLLATGQVH
jgi:hypothetical protein